jgi:UDP-2,4-diacetamido-2,4,6-trideoxy-beta-L-altropyranose hydrolase
VNIIIRSDASIHIGSGHIMRCLVLAQKLKTQGHHVSFASRPQPGDLIDFIQNKGFKVYQLITPKQWLEPESSDDYDAWLQVSWQEDAQNFIHNIKHADLIIVDHYGINAQWELLVKNHFTCRIFAIDDLVRQHQAEVILDQTLLRDPEEYHILNPDSLVLAGCDFALLNPSFVKYRHKALQEKSISQQTKVLISMGGIDQPNATLKVLKALSTMPKKPYASVLLSPRAPHYQSIKQFCTQHQDWLIHFDFVDDMAKLMVEYDLAIGAPGTTSWERACLGIPSIIIPLADNQKTTSEQLTQVGAAIKVEIDEIENSFLPCYQKVLDNKDSMRLNNLSICDGLGLQRVIKSIQDLEAKEAAPITLRPATQSDIEDVYKWQLLPQTRQYALTKSTPTWIEHQAWMQAKLTDKSHYFYIIEGLSNKKELNRQKIGVLRLDKIETALYTLSIFIDSHYFRQGFAKKALEYIDLLHPDINIQATVLEENTASQALFHSTKYIKVSATLFARDPINRATAIG